VSVVFLLRASDTVSGSPVLKSYFVVATTWVTELLTCLVTCVGYVPGLNAVIAGTVLAASELGWEVFGIQDGYDGLLFPDRYPGGGLLRLRPGDVRELAGSDGCILGTAPRSDPFRVRTIVDSQVEELDRSDDILARLAQEKIDAVVSVVGTRSMSTLFRLHRKGLKTICVPKSVQNDVAATTLSFGFNSALSFVTEMLQRCREAARSAHQIAVVEVMGEQSGWLALQSAIAVCADAVLIPEIRFDLDAVAKKLCANATSGLVVVAEGARPVASQEASVAPDSKLKNMLSPGATGAEGSHVIYRSGRASEQVALELQRRTDQEICPLVLGQLARAGTPTAVDRQLGLGYGAGAVRALQSEQSGVMVVFQPPDLKFVPLAEAINKVRTVPAGSELLRIARSLGISLGEG
jgi:6-phosphofructokinase 1